jgi:hypothetical protein
MEELRNGYILFGKHKIKRPLGISRCERIIDTLRWILKR